MTTVTIEITADDNTAHTHVEIVLPKDAPRREREMAKYFNDELGRFLNEYAEPLSGTTVSKEEFDAFKNTSRN